MVLTLRMTFTVLNAYPLSHITSSWPTTPKIFLFGPLRTSRYTPDINYILFYLRSQRLRVRLRPEARDLLSSLRLWHPSIGAAHPPLHTLLCLANPYLSIRLAVPSSRKPSLISRNRIRGPFSVLPLSHGPLKPPLPGTWH